eukprot:scaffold653_cov78-Skeletonema_dohrnii-CCMP3373.AAC.3
MQWPFNKKELIYHAEKTNDNDTELGNLFDSIANGSNRQETLLQLLTYNYTVSRIIKQYYSSSLLDRPIFFDTS